MSVTILDLHKKAKYIFHLNIAKLRFPRYRMTYKIQGTIRMPQTL